MTMSAMIEIESLFKLLKKNRFFKFQIVATIILGLIVGGISIYQEQKKETLRKQSLTYERQLEVLNQVLSNINNLKNFVNLQKNKLQEEQAVFERLKKEKEKLSVVVKADRQIVEALFRIQEERNRTRVWTDRLIGFLLGVISSLVATVFWSAFRVRRTKKYKQLG
jgi:predicted ATP-binding protein involved in virulence